MLQGSAHEGGARGALLQDAWQEGSLQKGCWGHDVQSMPAEFLGPYPIGGASQRLTTMRGGLASYGPVGTELPSRTRQPRMAISG